MFSGPFYLMILAVIAVSVLSELFPYMRKKKQLRNYARLPAVHHRVQILYRNMDTLIQHLTTQLPDHPFTAKLRRKYRHNLVVTVPKNFGIATNSYVLDKRSIFICIDTGCPNCGTRSEPLCDDEGYENLDVLMYVLLHLVAITINDTIGHDRKFWMTFGFLLHQASVCGIMRTDHDDIDEDDDIYMFYSNQVFRSVDIVNVNPI